LFFIALGPTAGAVFAVLPFLLFLRDAEGFAEEIAAINIFGIKNLT
jgi:hypothetical protein